MIQPTAKEHNSIIFMVPTGIDWLLSYLCPGVLVFYFNFSNLTTTDYDKETSFISTCNSSNVIWPIFSKPI